MADVLDTARFRTFIAQQLNVSVENVTGTVTGGHGDTMVSLVRLINVASIPPTELLDQATLDRLVDRARSAIAGSDSVGCARILVMILAGETSIRDVIPFPKTARGTDLMCDAPAPVPSGI